MLAYIEIHLKPMETKMSLALFHFTSMIHCVICIILVIGSFPYEGSLSFSTAFLHKKDLVYFMYFVHTFLSRMYSEMYGGL